MRVADPHQSPWDKYRKIEHGAFSQFLQIHISAERTGDDGADGLRLGRGNRDNPRKRP